MLIAILSDTHLRAGKTLPTIVWEKLEGVDLIIHAGDILNLEFLGDLRTLAPVEAVRGNCDGWELSSLPEQKIIQCEGIRMGITHGAYGLGKTTLERALRTFEAGTVDLIIFGHSHIPYEGWHEGVFLFNPGSPTDKRREPKYSFGLIEVKEKEINARHIYF